MNRLKAGIISALLCSGLGAGWAVLRIQPSLRESEAAQESHIGNQADRPVSLSRDDVQEALLDLAETQGEPVDRTIPDLRAGKIRYLTGDEEGLSPWTWNVNLSNKTFEWFIAGDHFFFEISGEFQPDGAKWKAVITGTRQT